MLFKVASGNQHYSNIWLSFPKWQFPLCVLREIKIVVGNHISMYMHLNVDVLEHYESQMPWLQNVLISFLLLL